MRYKITLGLLSFFLVFSFFVSTSDKAKSAAAKPLLNVGLVSFDAFPLDNAVRLEWETATETATAGFKVKRGQNGNYNYLQNPNGSGVWFILHEGSVESGAQYTITDETAVNNETYTYILVEVEANSNEIDQAEATVTVGLVPTDTPIVIGGENNTATATPIAPTATATTGSQASTNTPAPTNTKTATPTTQPAQNVTATQTTTAQATLQPLTATVQLPSSESYPVEPPQTDATAVAERIDSDSNVVAAQENNGADDNQAYPGNAATGTSQVENAGPESAPITQEGSGTAYPEGQTGNPSGSDGPRTIGSESSADQPATGQSENSAATESTAQTENNTSGRAVLWLSFIIALLVFIVAVIGAIILYTRKRSSSA